MSKDKTWFTLSGWMIVFALTASSLQELDSELKLVKTQIYSYNRRQVLQLGKRKEKSVMRVQILTVFIMFTFGQIQFGKVINIFSPRYGLNYRTNWLSFLDSK